MMWFLSLRVQFDRIFVKLKNLKPVKGRKDMTALIGDQARGFLGFNDGAHNSTHCLLDRQLMYSISPCADDFPPSFVQQLIRLQGGPNKILQKPKL